METKPQSPHRANSKLQRTSSKTFGARRGTFSLLNKKILIVMEAFRGEDSVAAICRKHGIVESVFINGTKAFLEAGKKRLGVDTTREATSDEVTALRKETSG